MRLDFFCRGSPFFCSGCPADAVAGVMPLLQRFVEGKGKGKAAAPASSTPESEPVTPPGGSGDGPSIAEVANDDAQEEPAAPPKKKRRVVQKRPAKHS